MKIAVDLSLYPLDANYIPPIQEFIDRLNTFEDVKIVENQLSTQVFGDYDRVMEVITQETKRVFEQHHTFSLVAKIVKADFDY